MQEPGKQAASGGGRRGTLAVLALLGLGLAAASFAAWSWRQRAPRPSPSPFARRARELPRRDVLAQWRQRLPAEPEGSVARRALQALEAVAAADPSACHTLRQAALDDPRGYSPLLAEALHDEREAVRGCARSILLEMLQDPERRKAVLGEGDGR